MATLLITTASGSKTNLAVACDMKEKTHRVRATVWRPGARVYTAQNNPHLVQNMRRRTTRQATLLLLFLY